MAALALTASAASAAAARPVADCTAANSFGAFGLQCAIGDGRNLCTLQFNGDPAKGFRIVTRSLAPGETGDLLKVQTLLMFASPQLDLAEGQRPAVEIRPGRNSPEKASGIPTSSHIVAVKIDMTDLTIWAVGEPATMTWTVKVDALPLVYNFSHADFLGALNAMTDCQLAYAKKHKL